MIKRLNYAGISAIIDTFDGHVRSVKILELSDKKSISPKVLEKLTFCISELKGTPFQKSVWRQIAKIPFGRTSTYGDIAKKLKNPKAVRAVAQACSKNPIPLIIPCHRVVAANGLGGFTPDIKFKIALLKFENESDL